MNDLFTLWAQLLNSTKGRFFTVEWVKKDGTRRRLNGKTFERLNPRDAHAHLAVKDVHIDRGKAEKRNIRKIDPRTILSFKCGDIQIGDDDVQTS